MKRQIIAFLSLFSLVVVLSVYYVLLPTKGASIEEKSTPVAQSIENATNAYYEALSLEREAYYEEEINAETNILVSSTYSNEEKEVALNNIADLNRKKTLEKELVLCLKSINYQDSYVEINNDYILVRTAYENPSKYQASEIIFSLQKYLDKDVNIVVEFHS